MTSKSVFGSRLRERASRHRPMTAFSFSAGMITEMRIPFASSTPSFMLSDDIVQILRFDRRLYEPGGCIGRQRNNAAVNAQVIFRHRIRGEEGLCDLMTTLPKAAAQIRAT